MNRVATVSLCILATTAVYAQPAATREAMHTVYDSLTKAYNKGDVAGIMKWTSADYKWTMMDGKVLDKDKAKSSIKDQLIAVQSGTWKIRIVNVVAAGPVANVVAEYKFEGIMLDPSKKPYKTTFTSTERQNWIEGPTGWRQNSDQVLNQQASTAKENKEVQNVDSSKTSTESGSGSGHQA
jgi:hypothetical protein